MSSCPLNRAKTAAVQDMLRRHPKGRPRSEDAVANGLSQQIRSISVNYFSAGSCRIVLRTSPTGTSATSDNVRHESALGEIRHTRRKQEVDANYSQRRRPAGPCLDGRLNILGCSSERDSGRLHEPNNTYGNAI